MEILLWPKIIMSFPSVRGCKDVFSVSVPVFLMNHHESEELTALVWA